MALYNLTWWGRVLSMLWWASTAEFLARVDNGLSVIDVHEGGSCDLN
jgi:hypothetical protein